MYHDAEDTILYVYNTMKCDMYENKLNCESDIRKTRVNVMRVCMERCRKSVGGYKETWRHEGKEANARETSLGESLRQPYNTCCRDQNADSEHLE